LWGILTTSTKGENKIMTVNVFMIPKNHEYIRMMKSSLMSLGVSVQVLKPFHWALFENLFKLIKYFKKGYKIIHIHWLWVFPLGIIMKMFYYLSRPLGIKIVWEMHNILPHNFKEKDKRKYKWFYEKVDAVIYHSEKDIQKAGELLNSNRIKKHIIMPHASFNESYENIVSKPEAREKLEISDDKKVILCFGFIRKNRGYEYLIKATQDMENVIVVIAGKILERDVYRELIESEKKIPNLRLYARWIRDDELQYFFNASDIVVLPYTQITTSGVIPLAYAFSRPIVTTSIDGIKDVVNEDTGVLVPPEDEDLLRDGIIKLFSLDYKKMGKFAYEYSKENFSWMRNAQKIKELYENLLR